MQCVAGFPPTATLSRRSIFRLGEDIPVPPVGPFALYVCASQSGRFVHRARRASVKSPTGLLGVDYSCRFGMAYPHPRDLLNAGGHIAPDPSLAGNIALRIGAQKETRYVGAITVKNLAQIQRARPIAHYAARMGSHR